MFGDQDLLKAAHECKIVGNEGQILAADLLREFSQNCLQLIQERVCDFLHFENKK